MRVTQPDTPEKLGDWFFERHRVVQVLLVVAVGTAEIAGHLYLWSGVFPALGAAVGGVPVLSTVVGWLFGGGAFLAWGVLLLNRESAKPKTVDRLWAVAWVWTAVALMCIPSDHAGSISLPTDFWAGAYASAYGVATAPAVALVFAGGRWLVENVFGREVGTISRALGWSCVGYSTLLLVWGSTLLRM
jgi:hypothetical protein